MRIGTLFSGIGAPEQAAIRVFGDDFKHVFACEYDKFARTSFSAIYDFDGKHFHKDINDMDGKQYIGKVDCIIGGSPCQDFSIAGLRAGIDGHRGQLIWQYYRIIEEIRPKIFIYENVKGMLSDKKTNKKAKYGQTFADFLEVFDALGYHLDWKVLNTKDYGVPQNRERVFVVGFLDYKTFCDFEFAPKLLLEKRLKDVLESEVDEKYYVDRVLKNYKSQANTIHDLEKEAPTLCAFTHGYAGGYVNEGIIGMLNYIIRKLTPLECWRLQDFPDEAHDKAKSAGVSNTQLYKQAGNSMTVAVVEMIFQQLKKVM